MDIPSGHLLGASLSKRVAHTKNFTDVLLGLCPWGLTKQISSLTLASLDVLKHEPVPRSGSASTRANEEQCAERAQSSMKGNPAHIGFAVLVHLVSLV